MAGIVGYGVYVPKYRIKAEEYIKAWGNFAADGVKEKSVVGCDEDVVTMAIEASNNAIKSAGIDPKNINTVYLATTSAPYAEKPSSVTVAAAIGAEGDVRTADFTTSTKAGTAALLACLERVKSDDSGRCGLIVASDAPAAAPDSSLEHALGGAAAAFIIGKKNIIATIDKSYSLSMETLGERFRKRDEPYIRDLELRVQHLQNAITATIKNLQKSLNLEPKDFAYVVVQQPDGRAAARIAGKLGFSKKQLSTGNLAEYTGDVGAASTLLSLAAVLESAKHGEKILLASYGSGSDAICITVGAPLAAPKIEIKEYLQNKEYIDYVKYLKLKKVLSTFRT
ncbi:MAG: hydroxymethylglutaryl-CoA synthase [bacterium]